MATKKISEVLGTLLAPYLAKYLTLSGGTMNPGGGFTFQPWANTGGSAQGLSFKNSDGNIENVMYTMAHNGTLQYIFLGGTYTDPTVCIRWNRLGIKTVSPQYPLDVVGDIHCTGKIIADGTNLASLVSLDDLKEVLSKEQVATLEAKVAKRIALADIPMQKADNQSENGGG